MLSLLLFVIVELPLKISVLIVLNNFFRDTILVTILTSLFL